VTVSRTVGRNADTFRGISARGIDTPALIRLTNFYLMPNLVVFGLVLNVNVVDVKATNIGLDLMNAVVTPVLRKIPDHMTVWTNKTLVVPMRLKRLIIKGVNAWYETESNSLKKLSFRPMEVCHN
jgi:hypothetical protein